jgi:hypothetical protein
MAKRILRAIEIKVDPRFPHASGSPVENHVHARTAPLAAANRRSGMTVTESEQQRIQLPTIWVIAASLKQLLSTVDDP